MHGKTILVSCGRSITLERASKLFSSMDATVRALKVPLSQALAAGRGLDADLVVADFSDGVADLGTLEDMLVTGGNQTSLFMAVDEAALRGLRLPTRVSVDFSDTHACDDEIKLRCRRLLWPGEMTSDADFVQVGALTVNLATYQVKVAGEPVDLTFMEYALLSFLVTHPGRIYSREVLLSQVWGFDYYGGSRTVDVHVRRLRAKLGPEVAQRIETVRGAGYLWSN